MNLWIIKNIKFGYRYTTNKSIRKTILDYFDDYLLNILSNKGTINDKFIIVGGLFYNTNPSIIAISDAHKYISKIASMMKVILISTPNDIRYYDGDKYTTLDLFKDIENVEIKEYNKDEFISYGECVIDVHSDNLTIQGTEISIPNAIQFDEGDGNCGVFINRVTDNRFTILNNKYSPHHITCEINTFDDFKTIEKGNDLIHLIVDNKLSEENKTLLNLEIFKLNPVSIKYKNEKVVEKSKLITNFDIKEKIFDTIGENQPLKEQFDRILAISKDSI